MSPSGAVLGADGEAYLALIPFSHSLETPSIRSLDGGLVKVLPANTTTLLAQTSGVFLISSLEGVFAATDQGWAQLQGREAQRPNLFVSDSSAVGVAANGTSLNWYVYEPTSAKLIRRVDEAQAVDASPRRLLTGNATDGLRFYSPEGAPTSVPGAAGCLWGDSVASVSENRRTLYLWADGGVAQREIPFKVDRLTCGCGTANHFVAESFDLNTVYAVDRSLNETQLPLVPVSGPGEWLISSCAPES